MNAGRHHRHCKECTAAHTNWKCIHCQEINAPDKNDCQKCHRIKSVPLFTPTSALPSGTVSESFGNVTHLTDGWKCKACKNKNASNVLQCTQSVECWNQVHMELHSECSVVTANIICVNCGRLSADDFGRTPEASDTEGEPEGPHVQEFNVAHHLRQWILIFWIGVSTFVCSSYWRRWRGFGNGAGKTRRIISTLCANFSLAAEARKSLTPSS